MLILASLSTFEEFKSVIKNLIARQNDLSLFE